MGESLLPLDHAEQAETAEAPALALPLVEPPQDISVEKATSRPLWQSADFMKFWLGQSISKLGDQFSFIALPLLLLQLTSSPLALGIFSVAAYFVAARKAEIGLRIALGARPNEVSHWVSI